ncbi:MAG: RNA polymerase sigma factor [Candidatus Dormibacteria bacterium]|jgi:RNA polymerase sigma-70 factor (ECF subfamily)
MTSPTRDPGPATPAVDFEPVYRAQASAIYRFCLTQLRDPSAAEDATADVFLAAWRSWHRIDPALGSQGWLFGIARNVVRDQQRARRRRQLLQSLLPRTSAARMSDPAVALGLREDALQAGRAIAQLTQRDQLLVGMRISSDLSHAEIGRIVGMSENSVRVAIHRALRRVRETLERMDEP